MEEVIEGRGRALINLSESCLVSNIRPMNGPAKSACNSKVLKASTKVGVYSDTGDDDWLTWQAEQFCTSCSMS